MDFSPSSDGSFTLSPRLWGLWVALLEVVVLVLHKLGDQRVQLVPERVYIGHVSAPESKGNVSCSSEQVQNITEYH